MSGLQPVRVGSEDARDRKQARVDVRHRIAVFIAQLPMPSFILKSIKSRSSMGFNGAMTKVIVSSCGQVQRTQREFDSTLAAEPVPAKQLPEFISESSTPALPSKVNR